MRISDWSSDVCSSDLYRSHLGDVWAESFPLESAERLSQHGKDGRSAFRNRPGQPEGYRRKVKGYVDRYFFAALPDPQAAAWIAEQIGRASCRERVCQSV